MAIVTYENRRVRTIRSTWIILALSLILAGAMAAALSALANLDPQTGERIGKGSLTSIIALAYSPIVLVPVSVMAAQSFGGEYRFGMIRLTLSSFPRRSNVMLGKLWVISLWILAFVFASMLVAVAVARVFPQYVDFTIDPAVGLYALRALAYSLAYCLIVFALVVITRNQALSIVLVLLWTLLIEQLLLEFLGGKFPWLDKALPMTSGAMFVEGQRMLPNAAIFFGTTLVALLAGWLLFLRRDA
ncbi:MAG: ABC transporter permease [Candidatus Nanopelagicales bacterium]